MIVDQIDINIFKGTNNEIRGQVFNATGLEFPIPSATFILTVKRRPFDDDDDAYVIKSSASGDFLILDSDLGKFRTELTTDDLADVPQNDYCYDIKMTTQDGKKYIIQRGRMVILGAVTQS